MACIPKYILVFVLAQLFSEHVSCTNQANATFSKDFLSIKIDFNEVVKPINPYNGCPTILNTMTLSKLGSNPICAFSFDRTLYIYPDKDGAINVGDTITFKADSVLDQNSTAINTTSVVIQSAISGAFTPNVAISEDGYVSGCVQDRYFLSAEFSVNSGYGYFSRFDWGLNIDNATSSEVTTAHNYLAGKAANASEVEITKSVLSSNESVKIEIFNIFGQNNSKIFLLKSSTQPVARIKGSRQIEIQEKGGLDLAADLLVSKCGQSLSMASYNWSIVQTSGVPSSQVTDFIVADTALFIKPYALKSSVTYNVTVEISYTLSDNSTGLATNSVSVSVKKTALVPEIVGGSRDIGKTQTLILIARDNTKSKATLGFMWTCKDVVTGVMCQDKNKTAPLTFGNSSAMSLSMAEGDFTVDKRYEFKVAITKDSETAFASIIVTIKSSAVSVVNVMSDRSQWVNDEKMHFRGVIQSDATNTNINYHWKISQSNGQEVVIPSSNGSITTDHTSGTIPHNVILTVPKNTLHPAYTYKVSLTASIAATSSQGSIHQKIGIAPRYGHLGVMPNQGVAFHTTFRLRSFAWIDSDMHKPLQFKFGYVKDSKRRYLTAWRNFNINSGALLPSGDSSNGDSLTLFVEIRNAIGLVAERQVAVTVSSQMSANDATLVQYYEDTSKHRSYEKLSVAVIGIIKSGLSNDAKRIHLGAYLNAVKGISFTPSLASVVIGTLSDVVSAASGNLLTVEMKEDIASLATRISTNLEREMPRAYLKSLEAQQMLDIFEGLIPNAASVSLNDTNIINSFKNTSNIIAKLTCRSILHDSNLKSLNNSLITILSGFSDFAREFDANSMISISKAYRQKFFQNTCSGSNYFKCAGLCWSITSYKDEKYFQAMGNIGEVMTTIHETRVIDLHTGNDVSTAADGQDFTVKLPITMSYNKSDSYVKCVMQEPVTLLWKDTYCRSSTVSETLNCHCTKLYPVAGIKQMGVPPTLPPTSLSSTPNNQTTVAMTTTITTSSGMSTSSTSPTTTPTPTPAPTAAPGDIITVVVNANCTNYIMDAATKSTFINGFKTDIAAQLNIEKTRIHVWNVGCGSIIVNLTISAPSGGFSAPSKLAAMTSLRNLLSSGLMRVTLSGGVVPALAPGGIVKTLPPPTTIPTTPPFIPVVVTNWMPMMLSFALILTMVLSIAIFCAWLHGRYYRKKQYTDINCNKPKPVKAEDAIENMNKKQRRLKLDSIMDDSITNAEVPAIIVAGPVSLKRTRGKSRINPAGMTTSRASSASTFSAGPRELPRLALDDTTSESEAETSFTNTRPRSGARSAKSRASGASSRAQSSVSVDDRPKSSKSRPGTSVSRRDRPRSSRPGTTQSRHLRPETTQSRRSRRYENRGADSSLGQ